MPTELVDFEVTGFFYDVNGALKTGDTNDTQFDVRDGFVTFTPRVGGYTPLIADLHTGSSSQDTQLTIKAITGQIIDGQLCSQNWGNTPGVQLVSNSAALALSAQGITSLLYDVSFSGGAAGLPNFAFVAPTDATPVCITDPTLQRLPYQGVTAEPITLPNIVYVASAPEGAPFAGVLTHLNHGRSTVIQAIGDSTVYGNGAAGGGGWVGDLGLGLGNSYDANVWACYWNDTNQSYDPPTVMRTSSQGARAVNANGVQYTAAAVTGDVEIIACITPSSWTTGLQTIIGKWNGAVNIGFFLNSGALNFECSSDGSTVRLFNSSASVPFTDGHAGWVRVTFRVNNGSGGSTATFYTSTDGTTWTQLGTPIIQSGTSANFSNPSDPYQLGAVSSSLSFPLGGTISWIQVRNALSNGIDMVPRLPEQWDAALGAPTPSGGPLVLLMNGGCPSKNLAYFDDNTRRPKMLASPVTDVFMIGDGFNETMATSLFPSAYLNYVNNIKSYRPLVPIIATTQNPAIAPMSAAWIAQRAAYFSALATAMTTQPGVTILDTARAFTGSTATLIDTDGEHPNTAGYQAEADWLLARLAPR